jgi:hypothetical protein
MLGVRGREFWVCRLRGVASVPCFVRLQAEIVEG